MKNSMLCLLFNLFNNFDHDESWANIFVLFILQIHKLSQCHLRFVFWRFFTFSWGWAFSRRSIILFAFYTAWTDIFSFNGWLICLNSCVFSVFRWISFSCYSFATLNDFTGLFDSWSKYRSSVGCANHFWLLLLEDF